MRNVSYLLEQTFSAMFRTMEDILVVKVNAGGRYTVSSEAQRFPPQILMAESVDRLRQHLQPHGVFGKQVKDVIRQLNEKGTARVPNHLNEVSCRQSSVRLLNEGLFSVIDEEACYSEPT